MDVELTRKQFWIVSTILGLLLFIVSMSVNMIGLYYDNEVKISCSDGSYKVYNKSDLNSLNLLCENDVNIYKYNDNTGLGVYFPDKDKIEIAIIEHDNNIKSINYIYS